MEALRLAGVETDHMDDRCLHERLEEILLFDLVVIVRGRVAPEIVPLLHFADQFSIPVVCDLDDYLFDDEVISCSDHLGAMPLEQAQGQIRDYRELILRSGYYTGATDFLRKQAASLGKASFVIPNGLNLVQLEFSRQALEEVRQSSHRAEVRIGYFSGTLTHQSDFRVVAPVLVRLLGEFPNLALTVVGDFNLEQFPEFAVFADRVEKRPFVDWRLLPSEIARADINLIPLVINPFTEGKSDLKYYEAAMVEVPCIASPTAVYQRCIKHGSNGFLARTEDDWHAALRALILDPDLRRQMGRRAYLDAIEHYVPTFIGDRALAVYRSILLDHRRSLGVEDDVPTVTVLLSEVERAIQDCAPALTLCQTLIEAGFPVTVQVHSNSGSFTAADACSTLARYLGSNPGYTVQAGGEIACCDILLATDSTTAFFARRYRHRSRWAAYLVSEYEPAHIFSHESRDDAERSYGLGLDLLVLDPLVAHFLNLDGDRDVKVLPSWVEAEPVEVDGFPEPEAVLMIGTASVPDSVWTEGIVALQRIGSDHPHLRLLTCGAPPSCGEPGNSGPGKIASMADPAFEAFLKDRPICVVLCPSGRPPWLHALQAKGCPVIAVVASVIQPPVDVEFKEGVIHVPYESHQIAQAIESLLIDRIRLGALKIRSAAVVTSMPRPIEATQALLREFRAACREEVKLHQSRDDQSIDRLLSDVA
jgi:glycosyltransferase involved in cell wall biosynthesis